MRSQTFVKRYFPVKWKIRIDPLVYPLWAFLLLAVPLPALSAWLGAVVFHESGHILAQYVFGARRCKIYVRPAGALIEGEDLGTYKNILCVLAGPFVGVLPVFMIKFFPELALFAFLLTFYNLIPLYPLDGGRILYLIGEKSGIVQLLVKATEVCVIAALLCIMFLYHTPVPLLPAFLHLREKYLAKRRNSGYNRATIEMR